MDIEKNIISEKVIDNMVDKIDDNLKYILEPLSVIIKLAILSKKNIGTKICVHNNFLFIQEVGIFQSIVRYVFNNNKVDIQYLYNPIEFACKFFLDKKKNLSNLNVKVLFVNAQKGIKKLIDTYQEHLIIVHTLYFYYNIIENHLSEKYNEKLFISDFFTAYYTNELLNKFYSIWNPEKIKIVLEMIQFIDNDKELNKSIKCLEEFMKIIDNDINLLILD